MQAQIRNLTGVARNLTDLLVSLAIVLLLVDILWPATGLPIVENIGSMVEGLSSDGLSGIIALLVFLMFFNRRDAAPSAPAPPPQQHV